MRIVLAVVVFDRFQNIREWVRCWNQCEKEGAQLVIIHNYASESDKESYTEFCQTTGIGYVPRVNVGFDVGAFQDVCRNRLEGFPEYDYLLWCCDDLKIMQKDFVKKYTDLMPKYDIVAMDISKSVRLHIRTTGFMIKKEVAERLQFPADPVTLKEECYQFEHRSPNKTFLQQVIDMGCRASKVCADPNHAPFWDTGFKRMRNREAEHIKNFPLKSQSERRVAFICPIYNTYPEIISSLINQTHKNWHLFLIHDGPSEMNIRAIVEAANDPRIEYIETERRSGNWGHEWRRDWIQKLKDTDFDYVTVTNGDNFHAPVYCEYMIKGFTNGEVAVYHSQMGHSYIAWGVINCKLQQGYIDAAGMMVRKDVAVDVGWNDITSHSSDWIYFRDIITKHGKEKIGRVNGCLLIHN